MKIIVNGVNSVRDMKRSFTAVLAAIRDQIKQGSNNFKSYSVGGKYVSVCKNKKSYTVYIEDY